MPIRHGAIHAPGPGARVDTQHDLGNGCVGYWCPSVTGGQGLYLPDISGQNNHGLLTNGPTWGAGRGAGEWGLLYDGLSTSVMVADSPPLTQTAQVTVAVWFNPLVSGSGAFRTIMAKRGLTDTPCNYELFLMNDGGINNGRLSWYSGTLYNTSIVPPVGTWSFAAATVNGTALSMYYNGAAAGSTTIAALTATTGSLRFGRPGDYIGVEWFSGWIGTGAIYNRALSAEQVARIYAESYSMIWHPGRKSYWYSAVGGLVLPRRFNAGFNAQLNPGVN